MAAHPHPVALLGSANPAGGRGASLPAPHRCAAGRRQPPQWGGFAAGEPGAAAGACPRGRAAARPAKSRTWTPPPPSVPLRQSAGGPGGPAAVGCSLSASSGELHFRADYSLFALFCLFSTPRCPRGVDVALPSTFPPAKGTGLLGLGAGRPLSRRACRRGSRGQTGGRWAGVQRRLQALRPRLLLALARSFPAWLSTSSRAASSPLWQAALLTFPDILKALAFPERGG